MTLLRCSAFCLIPKCRNASLSKCKLCEACPISADLQAALVQELQLILLQVQRHLQGMAQHGTLVLWPHAFVK